MLKKIILALVLFASMSSLSFAQETLTSDGGLNVTIPAGWNYEVGGNDELTISSPDGNVAISLVEIPSASLDAALEEAGEMIESMVSNFQVNGDGEEVTLNGHPAFIIDGNGIFEGQEVELGVLLVNNGSSTLFVFGMGTSASMSKHQASVDSILQSIGK